MDQQTVIIDSSYLFSLAVRVDSNYKRAVKISKSLTLSLMLIIPAEIFSETINALWKKIDRWQAIKTAQDILGANYYLFSETTVEIRQRALSKFESQKNSVSFTDCLVMAFADQFKTKKILGFDEAFSQNGYTLPWQQAQ